MNDYAGGLYPFFVTATRRRKFYERGGRRRLKPGAVVRWTWGVMTPWTYTP